MILLCRFLEHLKIGAAQCDPREHICARNQCPFPLPGSKNSSICKKGKQHKRQSIKNIHHYLNSNHFLHSKQNRDTLMSLTRCDPPVHPCPCLLGVCLSVCARSPAPWRSSWKRAGLLGPSQSRRSTGREFLKGGTAPEDTAGTSVRPASPSTQSKNKDTQRPLHCHTGTETKERSALNPHAYKC